MEHARYGRLICYTFLLYSFTSAALISYLAFERSQYSRAPRLYRWLRAGSLRQSGSTVIPVQTIRRVHSRLRLDLTMIRSKVAECNFIMRRAAGSPPAGEIASVEIYRRRV